MDLPKFQFLYAQLAAASSGDTLDDSLWNALLNRYFPQDEFIIAQRDKLADATETQTTSTSRVSVIGAAATRHVILIEHKHPSNEGQTTGWADAAAQLTRYMLHARNENKRTLNLQETDVLPYSMYGIVSIGIHSRFCILPPTADTLHGFPGTTPVPLHVKDDSQEIVRLLNDLVEKTAPYGLSSSVESPSA
jgi:hypothetical protein